MTKYHPLYYIFFLLLANFNCQAEQALLNEIQITLDNRHTQAEFTLNGPISPKIKQLTNPERIVIDFPATKFGKPLKVENPDASIISKIKGSKPDEEGLRFVFELKQPVQVRSRLLSGRVLGQQKLIIALIPAGENASAAPDISELSAKDKGGELNWKEQLRILNQRFAAQEKNNRAAGNGGTAGTSAGNEIKEQQNAWSSSSKVFFYAKANGKGKTKTDIKKTADQEKAS